MTLIFQVRVDDSFSSLQSLIATYAGWFFVWTMNIILAYVVSLLLGRFSGIRLAGAEATPEFTTLGWFSMLFSAGMGIGLLFYGVAEPMFHIGSRVTALGYAFGHQAMHALVAMNAIVSARVLSHNDSRLLLFDSMVHDGDRGGPLVSVEEGVVIGIINGRFDPQEAAKEYTDGSRTIASNTNISYAVAIDYGIALMDEEGLLTATTPM